MAFLPKIFLVQQKFNSMMPPNANKKETVDDMMKLTTKDKSMFSFWYKFWYGLVWEHTGIPTTWLEDNPNKKNHCIENRALVRGDGVILSPVTKTNCNCYVPFRAFIKQGKLQGDTTVDCSYGTTTRNFSAEDMMPN
jgi:hypothetical protein